MKSFLSASSVLVMTSLVLALVSGCTPSYTWGYAASIHPASTQAYILAILARDAGNDEEALHYYDVALRHTYSQKVADERRELARSMPSQP